MVIEKNRFWQCGRGQTRKLEKMLEAVRERYISEIIKLHNEASLNLESRKDTEKRMTMYP